MNVLTVGLLCIAAYFVLLAIWLGADRRRENGASTPEGGDR